MSGSQTGGPGRVYCFAQPYFFFYFLFLFLIAVVFVGVYKQMCCGWIVLRRGEWGSHLSQLPWWEEDKVGSAPTRRPTRPVHKSIQDYLSLKLKITLFPAEATRMLVASEYKVATLGGFYSTLYTCDGFITDSSWGIL